VPVVVVVLMLVLVAVLALMPMVALQHVRPAVVSILQWLGPISKLLEYRA